VLAHAASAASSSSQTFDAKQVHFAPLMDGLAGPATLFPLPACPPRRPARPDLGRPRHELALFSETPSASEPAFCSTSMIAKPGSSSPITTPRLNCHCYSLGSAPSAVRLTARTARMTGTGHRFNPSKLLNRPVTAKAIERPESTGIAPTCCRTCRVPTRTRTSSPTTRNDSAGIRSASLDRAVQTGGRPSTCASWSETVSTGTR